MKVKKAMERRRPSMVCLALLGAGMAAGAQTPRQQATIPRQTYDSRALQLLQQMAATYARLPGLDQRTEFSSGAFPVNPPAVALAANAERAGGKTASQNPGPTGDAPTKAAGPAKTATPASGAATATTDSSDNSSDDLPGERQRRSLRLLAIQPNRLRMELREYDGNLSRDTVSQWISDGKKFWTYTEENHQYTQMAAPARFHDFQKLNRLNTGSLELMMLLGANPFADVREQVDSVGYLGEATIRGSATEVVLLRAVQPTSITEARLYIGKEDHLLHRLVTESTPVEKADTPGKVGDELDALVDGRGPTPPPTATANAADNAPQFANSDTDLPDPEPAVPVGPQKTIIAYDNIITPLTHVYDTDFRFTIPDGALLFEPLQMQSGAFKQRQQNLVDLFRSAGMKKKKKPKVRVIKG
jgi:outer membrane lipoprotein-sorting protein